MAHFPKKQKEKLRLLCLVQIFIWQLMVRELCGQRCWDELTASQVHPQRIGSRCQTLHGQQAHNAGFECTHSVEASVDQ